MPILQSPARKSTEISFKEFAALAGRRRWTLESLAARFRGRIENPRQFFSDVLSNKHEGCVVPYRSVIEFFATERQDQTDLSFIDKRLRCGCGCGAQVFDRKKWATARCHQKIARTKVTDIPNRGGQVSEIIDVKV